MYENKQSTPRMWPAPPIAMRDRGTVLNNGGGRLPRVERGSVPPAGRAAGAALPQRLVKLVDNVVSILTRHQRLLAEQDRVRSAVGNEGEVAVGVGLGVLVD